MCVEGGREGESLALPLYYLISRIIVCDSLFIKRWLELFSAAPPSRADLSSFASALNLVECDVDSLSGPANELFWSTAK